MHDVFVSYSQVDKATADAVVAGLEARGIRCWIAPRDITPGASWGDAIVRAISGSRAMVLVLSANSNDSKQVIREVERAVANGVVIIPFRIQAIDPTGAMAYFLGTEHWLDALTPPVERHIDRLGSTVSALLSGDTPTDRIDQPPPVRRPSSRRSLSRPALAGVAALVVAGGVGFALLGGGSASPTTTVATTTLAVDSTTTTIPSVSLVEVSSFPMSLALYGFDIDGSFLAMANGDSRLMHMSIADPENLRPIAEYAVTAGGDVALAGDRAYVAGGSTPTIISVDLAGGGIVMDGEALGSPMTIYNVIAVDDLLFLGGHDYVGIVSIADPTAPELLTSWQPPGATGNSSDVAVSGEVGFFSAGWEGLHVFDLSAPGDPVEIGEWDSPDWIIDIDVVGDLLYVTLGDTGLGIVDVADPARPVLLGLLDLPAFASPIAVDGTHAFVGMYDDQGVDTAVAIVDVSDPESPTLLDVVGRYGLISDLDVSNGHLFLGDETRGLFVYEIVR